MAKSIVQSKRKGVAQGASTAVVAAGDLETMLKADQGAGFEEAGREAFAIPFLIVLQDLSPQTKQKMSGYVKGAKPGMIYNTVTQELFTKLRVVPCHFSQSFIEWVPRKELAKKGLRSGFVAVHPSDTPLVAKTVRDGAANVLPNGNHLQDTRSHFVLLVREDGSYDQAVIAMKSTQLKVSRRWMSQMQSALIPVNGRQIVPPTFAWSYLLTTEEESNDQGSWYSWVVSERERVESVDLYMRAKAFHQAMRASAQKVDYGDLQTADMSDDHSAPGDLGDDEIPDA